MKSEQLEQIVQHIQSGGFGWISKEDCRRLVLHVKKVSDAQLLAGVDDLPDNWQNYSGHWRCGYNQCRNRLESLIKESP